MKVALTLADPHFQNVVDPNREKARAYFARRGAGQVRLAAAGRPIHQDAASGRLPVGAKEFRVRERLDDLDADFILDGVHATDILERESWPFQLGRGSRSRLFPCG